MPTKEQIREWAAANAGTGNWVDTLAAGWAEAGAIWATDIANAEIAELVAALDELNAIVRSNFGIGHPEASRLLKKYGK